MSGTSTLHDLSTLLGPRSGENPFGFAPCRRGLLALDQRSMPIGFATDERGEVSMTLCNDEVVICPALTTDDLKQCCPDAVFVLGSCSASGTFEVSGSR